VTGFVFKIRGMLAGCVLPNMFTLLSASLSKSIARDALNWLFNCFAQEQEDNGLDHKVYDVQNGTYLDVRANDPSMGAGTKTF
jgi:hypothetical protein